MSPTILTAVLPFALECVDDTDWADADNCYYGCVKMGDVVVWEHRAGWNRQELYGFREECTQAFAERLQEVLA